MLCDPLEVASLATGERAAHGLAAEVSGELEPGCSAVASGRRGR